MFVNQGMGELKRVLLSPPSFLKPAPINEIAKQWKDTSLDVEKMEKEHEELIAQYRKHGVEVELLNPDEARPNAVFARDFGGCVKEGYILGKFKYSLRDKERTDYEARMKELGIPKIAEVKKGCFEGGDFMFLDEKNILVGLADRTDKTGLEELKNQLEPLGYRLTGVELPKEYLHLDMCFNLIDEKLAVAYEEGMPKAAKEICEKLKIKIIPVEEESIFLHSCNLQALGNKRVFSLKKNNKLNQELIKNGMTVIELDISEILKAGGGPHCMTFPLNRK